ncbi:MAG: TetR/AcrR family transcriptional regulator [Actinomycetia bacterium]|nr:TetR/AcrR family transcriptional regulator [Actinomycetes bacterium]
MAKVASSSATESTTALTTGEATRARLLDAAIEVLAERGYNAVRVDDIVQRADVSHGTFYLYFANKDAMVVALAERCAAELGGLVAGLGSVSAAASGRNEVRDWLEDFIEHYRTYGVVIRSWVEQSANPELTKLGVDSLANVSSVLIDRIRETHPGDAETRVTALIALMERFTYLAVNRDLGEPGAVVDTAATVIHRSFFAEAG